jgi:hypothetical protein
MINSLHVLPFFKGPSKENNMDDSTINQDEQRRAIRMNWNRPVQISQPAKLDGLAINVSATGILVNIKDDPQLKVGDLVEVIIPHATRDDTITVTGKIVRRERSQNQLQIAIDID